MIKKIILTALILGLGTLPAFAEGTVVQEAYGSDHYKVLGNDMKVATFTITDDAGSVPLTALTDPGEIQGWYIMAVEVKSSSDDSLNVLIETALGTDLFGEAFAAATGGEIKNATDRWPIYSIPKIDVTNMSGDTVTVNVTFVR